MRVGGRGGLRMRAPISSYARAVRQGTASPGYITGGVIVGHRTLAGKAIAAIGSAPMLTVNLQKDGAVVATTRTSGGGFWLVSNRRLVPAPIT